MGNINLKLYKNLGFGVLTALLILTMILAVLTYTYRDMTIANPVIMGTINHHLTIIMTLIVLSISFGFFWSQISYVELRKSKKESKNMMEMISLFLSNEEKNVIDFIVLNHGKTSQAEISRLPGMTRVKAYRLLQKMKEKNLLDIEGHGKVRKVILKKNILNVLSKG